MAGSRRKIKAEFKPDLIPIMDGVFIMIFFLLAIGNFIKINEIGSDLPIYKINLNKKPPEKKFALKVSLTKDVVRLTDSSTGKELFETSYQADPDLISLTQKVKELKQQHQEDDRATIVSSLDVKYLQLVKVLDAVRQHQVEGIGAVKMFNRFTFENTEG